MIMKNVGKTSRSRRSKEEIQALIVDLAEQMEAFTMELSYEKLQVEFRETYEAWYDERITLDDVLERMMAANNLCKRIGVWSK